MQAEKNLAWEAAQQQAQAQAQLNAMGAQAGSGPCKLLVTNLNVQIGVSLLLVCWLHARTNMFTKVTVSRPSGCFLVTGLSQ